MERDGFCRSLPGKLIYFLPRYTEGLEKNRACACHGIQTGPLATQFAEGSTAAKRLKNIDTGNTEDEHMKRH